MNISSPSGHLLILDDDEHILLTTRILLKRLFLSVDILASPKELAAKLSTASYDVVLLDMNFLPGNTTGEEGLALLRQIKITQPEARIILMTAYGDISLAVKAMKIGATDFIVKPWANHDLLSSVEAARRVDTTPNNQPESRLNMKSRTMLIKGNSPTMEDLWRVIEKVAPTDANVLIMGENGTGKELVAREIHNLSGRSEAPFVHVDLGAVAAALFEAELFGHEKGAFTDARELRQGPFEQAAGGTLFLDEIGNLPLALQSKLLTVLQSRKVTRLGSNRQLEVNFRLICATNSPLGDLVKGRQFRDDLYFRINTVELTIPPLRERGDDIPALVRQFLDRYTTQYNKTSLRIGNEVIRSIMAYEWPGNIRELQHVIERAVIMCDGERITNADLRLPVQNNSTTGTNSLNLEMLEREAIRKALLTHGGNLTQAALELGLGRTTLYRKMEKYGL
ncbi:MAG TPA: sigma-54-dependent Fis family transcriptional regulator [Bacteroidales bacterium]|nr:MAG: hypothetical protein A2X11_01925 [Bacteroidetes bacterium GWE2_42_24]OFY28369.1 MAG: hypothetical protein A2X09_12060 [Bacteroidetes bacterium GWF2_43_11]HAQ65197.1 sigma-54-dependent Fis family transcriptional regulator [Bacteroidales bacterium]HBZ65796.1 sigma-54-dependent Fis family transcriptional regulator [Bacteroidales bacterium]